MILLPAIDLLDGKVVRLAQGKRDQVTVYSEDPVAVAKSWQAQGATWLHVVDLNGAFEGQYANLPIAERIIKSVGIHVELSGGIRSQETLQRCLAAGAQRVVLGTKACEDPAFIQSAAARFGEQIAVAIDAKAGQVVSRGWVAPTNLTPAELTRRVVELGVRLIICTDVSRDGMLAGPNLTLLSEVLDAGVVEPPSRLDTSSAARTVPPRAPQVIASGGIAKLDDLTQLRELEPRGVIGAIIGKALYERTIDLAEAIRVVSD